MNPGDGQHPLALVWLPFVQQAGSLGRDPSPLPTGEGATYKFLAFASLSRIPRSRMAVLYLELQTRALKAPLIYES